MRHILKNYVAVVLLSILFVTVSMNWYFTGSPYRFFLSVYLEHKSDNIEDVDVEFVDKKVFLNVRLRNPSSCKMVLTELGINNILVGQKIYKPSCRIVEPKLIRIVYTRITDV